MSRFSSISDIAKSGLKSDDDIASAILEFARKSGKTSDELLKEAKALDGTLYQSDRYIRIIQDSTKSKQTFIDLIKRNPKLFGTGAVGITGVGAATGVILSRQQKGQNNTYDINRKVFIIKEIRLDTSLISLTYNNIIVKYEPIVKICIDDTFILNGVVSNIYELNGKHKISGITSTGDLVIQNPSSSISKLNVTDLTYSTLMMKTNLECQLKNIDTETGQYIGDFVSAVVNPVANTGAGAFNSFFGNILGNSNTLLIGCGVVFVLLLLKK